MNLAGENQSTNSQNSGVEWSNTKGKHSHSHSYKKKQRSVFLDPNSPLNSNQGTKDLRNRVSKEKIKKRSVSPNVPRIPLEKIKNQGHFSKSPNRNRSISPTQSQDKGMTSSHYIQAQDSFTQINSKRANRSNLKNSIESQSLLSNSMTLAEVNRNIQLS